jgi:hypothetical protein
MVIPGQCRMADGERIKVGPSSLPALFRGAARTPPDDFLAKSPGSGRLAPHFFLLLRASAHNDALIPASFALVQLCLCEGNPRSPEVSVCCFLSLSPLRQGRWRIEAFAQALAALPS